METDVKTKYIDITQLPVAEDENTPLTYEHFERLREELEKPNRRYEFEGDWGLSLGVDKSLKDLDVSVVMRYELGTVFPRIRMIGVDMSPAQHAHYMALCSPSRNAITNYHFYGKS